MFASVLILFIMPATIFSQKCPEAYLRFSKEHSFCLPANSKCEILSKGIKDKAEIEEILKVHNDYRNRVATGQEKQAGKLPSASNMLQLTWDEELAAIAQKWAEQCKFEHDCGPCRTTKSYSAGQNIAYSGYGCGSGGCDVKKPDWSGIITMFYNEVKDFDKALIKSMDFNTGKMIGHFTQVVWAETYKVGCGYVVHKYGKDARQFYVCNYGPAGNMYHAPIYKEGSSCSSCPKNSCCGTACKGGNTYAGLCHLLSTPPVYSEKENLPFSCSFEKNDANCAFNTEGSGRSELTKTLSGTYLTAEVNQNGYFLVHFQKPITARKGTCMNLYFRKGPNVAGDAENNKLQVIFQQNGKQNPPEDVWSYASSDFIQSPVQIPNDGVLKFSLKFSAPAGSPPQYLQMKKIEITNEGCHYGK